MTNKVCNDWLMEETDQQGMSNASVAMMTEAQQNVVIKEGEEDQLEEIVKGGDVIENCKTCLTIVNHGQP